MEAAKRILVVDDEPFFCDMLQAYLLKSAFELPMNLHCVSNGKEALDFVTRKKFDLVITDNKMPHMNGVELIREIEKLSGHMKPENLILVSAELPKFDSILPVTFVEKPIDFVKLKRIIMMALQHSNYLQVAN